MQGMRLRRSIGTERRQSVGKIAGYEAADELVYKDSTEMLLKFLLGLPQPTEPEHSIDRGAYDYDLEEEEIEHA